MATITIQIIDDGQPFTDLQKASLQNILSALGAGDGHHNRARATYPNLEEQIWALHLEGKKPIEIWRLVGMKVSKQTVYNRINERKKAEEREKSEDVPQEPTKSPEIKSTLETHDPPPKAEKAQDKNPGKAFGDYPANFEEAPIEKNPEPKSMSKRELDDRIWEEHKDGLTPKEISDRLCAEGYYYGEGTVRGRLRAQGADI